MTVSSTINKNVYVGDGALLVFAYTFKIFADSEIEVTIQDTSVTPQTEITLVLTTDYTVSDAGNPSGGNVTLVLGGQLSAAPSATDNITIRRILPITQLTDYVENDDFPADSHETALDRGTMVDQQLQETLNRALVIPSNLTGIDTTLPTPEADAPIGWNSTGTGLTNNPTNTNLSQIDSAATPDFIGNAATDGVLRVNVSNISYTDGGNFITLNTIQDIGTGASPTFAGLTVINAITEFSTDGTLAGNSNAALPTEQAVKTYVDAQTSAQNEFTELTDTPANFTGASLDIVRVNAGETALEFVTLDYSFVSTNDAATDVTGAELEELTDGSTTTLHVHNYAAISGADAGTDVTAAELEQLTDGSTTTLHSHTVADNTSTQRVEVVKNSGAVVGTRKQLNFIEGSNVTLTIADDGGNDQVDITITSSGGGGGGPTVVTLTDAATIATDASAGTEFRVTTAGDRTLGVPTNPTDGQIGVWAHKASAANRTLTLAAGAGGFRFGTDLTTITTTLNGETDYITAKYHLADNFWDVISYIKGF